MLKFSQIAIGEKFHCNGNLCTKKSTRTAYIDGPAKTLWFYFGKTESVGIGWGEYTYF